MKKNLLKDYFIFVKSLDDFVIIHRIENGSGLKNADREKFYKNNSLKPLNIKKNNVTLHSFFNRH